MIDFIYKAENNKTEVTIFIIPWRFPGFWRLQGNDSWKSVDVKLRKEADEKVRDIRRIDSAERDVRVLVGQNEDQLFP